MFLGAGPVKIEKPGGNKSPRVVELKRKCCLKIHQPASYFRAVHLALKGLVRDDPGAFLIDLLEEILDLFNVHLLHHMPLIIGSFIQETLSYGFHTLTSPKIINQKKSKRGEKQENRKA